MTSMDEVAEEVLANNPKARASLINFHPKPVLMPGNDYHDGHLWMTFPVIMPKTEVKGKGKNAYEVTKEVPTTIAMNDEGVWFEYTEEDIRDNGFSPPTSFIRGEDRWLGDNMQEFMTEENRPQISGADLFTELRAVYEKYMEFSDDHYYDLMPLFIMGSYLYRIFAAVPYIHFNGTKASGKSQNMRLLKAFGFNTVWASNMSTASLFRQVSGCPGIICVDEAESFEGERGDELRKLLNAGYIKGEKATRVEPTAEGKFTVVSYDVFSPKVLASINPLEPVLQSRCVVVGTAPAIRPIPEFDHDDPEWLRVRNHLYLWAYQSAPDIQRLYDDWNTEKRYRLAPDLVNRAWQISQMFIVLAEHVGGEELSLRLITHLSEYFAASQRAAEAADNQRRMLRLLPTFMRDKNPAEWRDGQPYWRLSDLYDMIIENLEEDQQKYYTSRRTGKDLRSLGFTDSRSIKKGTAYRITEDEVRALFKRHRMEPDEGEAAWLAGEVNYVQPGAISEAKAPEAGEPEYNWLESYEDET